MRHWLLNERPERLRKEAAARPKITPEIKKAVGYKAPPPPSEEALERIAQERKHVELGEAISIDSSGPDALSKLIRYETRLSRLRDQSLAAYLALKREQEREIQRELNP
jgi:hypothetical protein